jgi:hypothetical protein
LDSELDSLTELGSELDSVDAGALWCCVVVSRRTRLSHVRSPQRQLVACAWARRRHADVFDQCGPSVANPHAAAAVLQGRGGHAGAKLYWIIYECVGTIYCIKVCVCVCVVRSACSGCACPSSWPWCNRSQPLYRSETRRAPSALPACGRARANSRRRPSSTPTRPLWQA